MTDDRYPSDPLDDDHDFEAADDDEDDFVEAVFISSPRSRPGDPYDLGQLFLSWAWGAHYRDWKTSVRIFARALRGLTEAGLIERRTIRRRSGATHHGFVLTEDGHEALRALAGDCVNDGREEQQP